MSDLAPGYNLSRAWMKRLSVLDWVYDRGGDAPGTFVPLADLLGGEPKAAQALAMEIEELGRRGWLTVAATYDLPDWSCALTVAGLEFLEEVRKRRGDVIPRRRSARDALLHWLFAIRCQAAPTPANVREFATSPYGSYYGHAFNETEITQAIEYLMKSGYVMATRAMRGDILHPSITAQGEQLLEQGLSVNAVPPKDAADDAPPPLHIHVNGSNNNVAAFSPGASQSVRLSQENQRQILAVADALTDTIELLGLKDEQRDEAQRVSDSLRGEIASAAPAVSRLRQLLSKAQDVAVSGTGTAVGQAVVALAQQALDGMTNV
ncbi:hypothetical protein [Aquipuribacter sp. SD81]|uniref:hypothetical protein n=1 Tax=Aquipuribacter sp. SD81 TaxID=3127703 RepID=UPI003015F3A0